MNYTILSPKDTDIWISNVSKTLSVLRDVISIYDKEVEAKKELAIILYHSTALKKFWAQLWYGFYSTDDIIIGLWSGNISTLNAGFGFAGRLSKIPPISTGVLNCRDLADKYIEDGSVDFVMSLSQAWSTYASIPFAITEQDVFNYFKVQRIHKECKTLLEALGVYDEAFNLVEDSVSSS